MRTAENVTEGMLLVARSFSLGAAEIVIVVVLALATAGGLLFWRRRRPSAEPVCGRCGYCVTGLTTFICPECGSDLREVGIVGGCHAGGASSPAQWPLALRLTGWTLAVGCIAFVASWAAHQWLWPADWSRGVVLQLRDDAAGHQVEMQGSRIVRAWGRARIDLAQPGPPDQVVVAWKRPATTGLRFTVDRSGEYTWAPDAVTSRSGPLDERALLAMASDAGMSPADVDRVKDSAPALLAVLSQARQSSLERAAQLAHLTMQQTGSTFPFATSSYVDHAIADPWHLWAWATIAAVAAWLAGVRAILRRHRQRPVMQSAATPDAHASANGVTRTMTVMFSDMKDFTARTAGGARRDVVEIVRRHRDLVQPIARRRGGRIVKSLGDALLLAFDSATEAALAALEIQSAAAQRNRDAFREADRIDLRIAICTGEVVLDEQDIFGDPVNLASRVQQLAETGQVLMSEATYAMVNKQEVQCAPAGEHTIKGLPRAVAVYRALNPDLAGSLA